MRVKDKKWVQLSNGYWLKIIVLYPYYHLGKAHMLDIAVGKTKRIVNDHYNRTRKSPKSLYKKSSNNKGGLEALLQVVRYIENIHLPKGSILRVEGSDEQRVKVYRRLLRYGFKVASSNAPGCEWHKREYFFKEIN